jgi:hypothetical protein
MNGTGLEPQTGVETEIKGLRSLISCGSKEFGELLELMLWAARNQNSVLSLVR